ncbi:ABC transporter permease [Thermococcus barophilus]|uniref:ABC-type multidrug transport system permease n=1 Tax=Thermococcus barophilus TaxID=55802 RepID=A0A0S1XC04_THEBA|nr:ABC transporter permease [Thermococcus barophilus]ALM75318.1 ABC-type multidrug transport system permease [Thermococcus barophilus]
MKAFTTMAYRQIKRFFRARSRVIGMFVNPLMWLIFFGLGWSKVFNFPAASALFGGVDYLSFLAPGITAMTIFNASFIAGISVIWDKQFGFLKEILVAPASRKEAITGRIVGDSVMAVVQGLIILLLTFTIASSLKFSGVLPMILIGFLLAIAFSSFGVSLALRMTSMEGFQMIMSFLMLPLMFLSGAFYPVETMPTWMQYLAYINPLTYAVDAARHVLVNAPATTATAPIPGIPTVSLTRFSLMTDIGVLAVLALAFLAIAMISFERATIE